MSEYFNYIHSTCLYSVVYYIRFVDHSQDLVLNQKFSFLLFQSSCVYLSYNLLCLILYILVHRYVTDCLVGTGLFVHVCMTAFSCF